jgi:protein O-GlcNAc transferase
MGTALELTLSENVTFQRGWAALRAGKYADAELLFRKLLQTQPKHVAALNLLGVVLTQLGKFADAEPPLRLALDQEPNSETTLYNYGFVLKALNRPAEALDRFTQALDINPSTPDTWNNRGTAFSDLQRYEEAVRDFDKAIELNPRFAEACFNKGKSLVALNRFEEAFSAFDTCLALKPDLTEARLGRAVGLSRAGRHDEALAVFDRTIRQNPNLAEAWLGRGNVLAEFGRTDDACAAYDRALALQPSLAEAWVGRGNVFSELKRYDDALAAFDHALTLRPDVAEAWYGRGNVLAETRRHDEAFVAYDRALALNPNFAKARLGHGNLLVQIRHFDEALAAYDKALGLSPGLAEAWLNRGKVFTELGQQKEAYFSCDKALKIKGNLKHAASLRLYAKMQMSDWTDLAADAAQLLSEVRNENRISAPFALLTIPSLPADQLQCARRYVADLPTFPAVWNGTTYSHERIRIAYVSADLCEHPIAYLAIGMFEQHDRSRFETIGIALGALQESDFCRRLKNSFERFIEIHSTDDQAIAERLRELEIDIAVDLSGFTRNNRLGIFARRPAPIQVNYLGYASTMGADYFDYIIADSTVIPAGDFPFYSEKVIWLPDSFMANDDARVIAARTPPRGELQLPEEAFVFCCFNQSYKINPAMFDIWTRLLKNVDSSVLWLKENDAVSSRNLRLEAERRGITPDRLVFAPRVAAIEDHLARQRQADLFLDTLPYNAHTTASDALWAGVPVLTCMGETFAGRVAGSLLRAVGLSELVTGSFQEYEALALRIAHDPAFHDSLKKELASNRKGFPLFDTARFTRNIESAFTQMQERHRRGEPPASLAVVAGE